MERSGQTGETMARITGIDHVQLAMPVGSEGIARAFYAGLLELPELPKPAHLALHGGVWFQCGAAQLHLGGDPDFVATKKAHPALIVDSVDDMVRSLRAQGVESTGEEPVDGRQRAVLFDPFGNRIELIAAR